MINFDPSDLHSLLFRSYQNVHIMSEFDNKTVLLLNRCKINMMIMEMIELILVNVMEVLLMKTVRRRRRRRQTETETETETERQRD